MNSLDYGLLVPREPVRFRTVEGSFEPVNIPIQPLVRTTQKTYDFEGFESGRRSGLLRIDGAVFRIKGCRIEQAFQSNGLYRDTRDTMYIFSPDLHEPFGGQLVPDAGNELVWLEIYNQILAKEGFPVCNEPVGVVHYAKRFKRDRRPNYPLSDLLIRLFAALFITNSSKFDLFDSSADQLTETLLNVGLREENLGAAVVKIKGDTRLPEIYGQKVQNVQYASIVAYRLGLIAGAQKRLTENTFLWVRNSHAGNYVVFLDDGYVHLAMTDFDDTSVYSLIVNQLSRLNFHHFQTQKALENLSICQVSYLNNNSPDFFRREFRKGFEDGYRNPDKREPVTLEILCESFDLKSAKPVSI